jgi:hypothetical protein
VPLNTIVNNTIATLSGGALTSAAKEWVQMAGDAGSYVTKSMPLFIQTALQTVLEGVQVNGKPVMQLPALKEATLDTATALKALPQLLNITMAGMEINKLTGLADQLHIKLPTMSSELTNSIEELKKIPQLLQVRVLSVRVCVCLDRGFACACFLLRAPRGQDLTLLPTAAHCCPAPLHPHPPSPPNSPPSRA